MLEQVKAQQAAYPVHQQRGHTARRRPPKQPRSAGSAIEGASAAPRCCRGAGLKQPNGIALVFRYVTDLPADQRAVAAPGVTSATEITVETNSRDIAGPSDHKPTRWQPRPARRVDAVADSCSPLYGKVRRTHRWRRQSGANSSLKPNFLASWENTGKFINFSLHIRISHRKHDEDQYPTAKIPYAMEQGINCALAGN